MRHSLNKLAILLLTLLLTSCGAYFNQPTTPQDARISEKTQVTRTLETFPLPADPIVVGVYNFKDQTGQYKNVENGSTFSTAVTQGATTILIKALEDSQWFRPIERENLGNLLNERNIIRTTRDEYRTTQNEPPKRISPLLFAGILLEGGVISYDSNILTGGVGARYFGAGTSSQYRQDRITVYLRAISTSTGEVLKTVNVSKTILSQGVDVGLFKYVNFQRLLEVETGFTKNEPAQLAVQEAIEKAVEILILEGLKDKLWATKSGPETDQELIAAYNLEQEVENATGLYERAYHDHDYRHTASGGMGVAFIDGDYTTGVIDFMGSLGYKYRILPEISIGLQAQIFKLNATSDNIKWWLSESAQVEYNILPHDKLAPFIYGGPGLVLFADDTEEENLSRWDAFFKLQLGAGLEYAFSDRVSLVAQADWNSVFSDKLDNFIGGRRNDFYYNIGIGINYHFGSNKTKLKHKRK
ncbi:outer membrane beta-barrel protein [Rasiella rasia]|uniref:Outer membrane beta-barrel protein n=1 Tax=Rasiella rasia TaxID=2744027 RepID=A0A6G6GQ24_9FLAO|nr:CsgG/HfaB family protein [Rasiella rasia]QIE60533.1 outer membrane beta-barrel protein [Rasiella rasia]